MSSPLFSSNSFNLLCNFLNHASLLLMVFRDLSLTMVSLSLMSKPVAENKTFFLSLHVVLWALWVPTWDYLRYINLGIEKCRPTGHVVPPERMEWLGCYSCLYLWDPLVCESHLLITCTVPAFTWAGLRCYRFQVRVLARSKLTFFLLSSHCVFVSKISCSFPCCIKEKTLNLWASVVLAVKGWAQSWDERWVVAAQSPNPTVSSHKPSRRQKKKVALESLFRSTYSHNALLNLSINCSSSFPTRSFRIPYLVR